MIAINANIFSILQPFTLYLHLCRKKVFGSICYGHFFSIWTICPLIWLKFQVPWLYIVGIAGVFLCGYLYLFAIDVCHNYTIALTRLFPLNCLLVGGLLGNQNYNLYFSSASARASSNLCSIFVRLDSWISKKTTHPARRLKVTSPAGNEVHTLKGTSGDKFEFKAPRSGMYKFCFHNPHKTPETVAFYIHIGHIPNEHNLAKDEHLDPVNVKIAELREALESVTAEQQYLKARDARHRRTNESTRKRVLFYTLGEYLLLAFLSVLQVVYIRQLFSKSVGYNRV